MIKLLVGLGNYGSRYENTRHNIGFDVINAVANVTGGSFQKKFHSLVLNCSLGGVFAEADLAPNSLEVSHNVTLMKPQTYMNLSGKAVSSFCQFYKVKPCEILVFHDDIDLPCGRLKVKKGGGAGGHNGLKSIDQAIGKDYWRVRMGVGRPVGPHDVSDYVLGSFSKDEVSKKEDMVKRVLALLPLMMAERFSDVSVRMGER